MAASRLPLLDIALFRADPTAFVAELRRACHRVGFFTLRHRLPPGLAESALDVSRRFFALPADAKARIDYARSPAFRGYMRAGVENTAGRIDLREQLEIAPEAPPTDARATPPWRRLAGANQWPDDSLPALRPRIEEYIEAMLRLSHELTGALSLALGLSAADFAPLFADGGPHWQLKLASYLPAAEAAEAGDEGGAQGCGAHTDSGFLTLLLQDDAGGLQAFTEGAWRDVPPAGPDVLVCNLGEVAEMLSGGYLLATPHRVLSGRSQRHSIPFFFNPALAAHVRPIPMPTSLPWERDAGYDAARHWRRPHNAQLAEYGANALKSLARSHPAVLGAHHADLRVLGDGRVVQVDGRADFDGK